MRLTKRNTTTSCCFWPIGGIEYILKHLDFGQPLFPRCIMTKRLGCQVEVFDRESMIREFELSDWEDCRISAYPKLTQYNGINLVAPSLVMIDIDSSNSTNNGIGVVVAKTLTATLNRIYKLLQVSPTVLWTGNGYHVYLPIKAFVLEEEQVFADLTKHFANCNLTTEFLRFAEKYLSGNKHDPCHKPSVNSCLLRVPGSINSKNGEQVTIVQEWDGHTRPAIQYLLREFRGYLIQKQLDEINSLKQVKPQLSKLNCGGSIGWVEQLLQTPIADHRKYCIWRIFAPYFTNIRGLSEEDSCAQILQWLEQCGHIRRLGWTTGPMTRVRDAIRRARRRGYYPISFDNLAKDNPPLFGILSSGTNSSRSEFE